MSEPPVDPGDPFSQIPLFREIQRVLLSSSGAVNWELARQVGIATAVMNMDDPTPSDADRRGLEEAVRIAELQVGAFTGLPAPSEIVAVRAVRRSAWVEESIADLKATIEPAAERLRSALSRLAPPDENEADASPLAVAGMDQLAPLLLGAQAGSVFGYLAQHVFGGSDIAVPRASHDAVSFVVPNIAAFERDWSLPPVEFRLWVALHEVAHRFEFAGTWPRAYLVGLLSDFTSTLELDVSGIRERLERLDTSDPESLQHLMGGDDDLFGTVLDDEQRLKLARVQAFMAAAEGYGDHVVHVLGSRLLGSYAQISEAIRRHREDEQGDPVFERLLGVEMSREHYRLGRGFCDRVAEDAGEGFLASMWDSPEALPSLPELTEPTLWMARTG